MEINTRVILKSGKDVSVRRFHPWIFSGAIKKIKGIEPSEGDLVHVFDNKDEYLATGHYQIGSIAVRILSFSDEAIDENFWNIKIKNAINYRKDAGLFSLPSTNAYRLIHAEGDNLPGLIVDFYNGVAVMQMHSIGMYHQRLFIAQALKDAHPEIKAVYEKSASTLPFKAEISPVDGFILGDSNTEVLIEEYGNRFAVNVEEGQKTGFFLDQRENRKMLGDLAKGKRVLNMFGYTGGFSVFALQQQAEKVVTVDVSGRAIDLTNKNIALNFDNAPHEGIATDAFKFFEQNKEDFDIIILDPPAFAKHQNVLHNALQGYKRLNARAIESIKPGGIIFTFSCSQVVSKENFRKSVFAAAANSGRGVKILHQLSQPIDHPVNIYHPESEYLKGLVLYVE